MHAKLVQVLLVLICSLIFGYYAFQSLKEYLSYNTVTKQNKERQEQQLMPQICISSPELRNVKSFTRIKSSKPNFTPRKGQVS